MTAWACCVEASCWMPFSGDPAWLPHPVVYMGKAISRLEKFPPLPPAQNASGRAAGRRGDGVLPAVGTTAVSRPLSAGSAAMLSPATGAGRPDDSGAEAPGRKGLVQESTKCLCRAEKGSLPAARKAGEPHRGRDTRSLDCRGRDQSGGGVRWPKNASDGVIALCFICCCACAAGPDLQAINTNDSMLGYKTKNILLLAVRRQSWTMWQTIDPSRLDGAALDHGGGVHPAMTPREHGVSGGGTRPTITPAPTAPRPRRLRGRAGRPSWPAGLLFRRILPETHHRANPLRPIEPGGYSAGKSDECNVPAGFALAFGCAIRGFLG